MWYLFNPFAGEIGRTKWWVLQVVEFVILFVFAFVVALATLDFSGGVENRPELGSGVIYTMAIFLLYMNFSTCLNRLRDTNRSGWWYLLFHVPFIGIPCMIYFCGIVEGSGAREQKKLADVFGGSNSATTGSVPKAISAGSIGKQTIPQSVPKTPIGRANSRDGFGKRGPISA